MYDDLNEQLFDEIIDRWATYEDTWYENRNDEELGDIDDCYF